MQVPLLQPLHAHAMFDVALHCGSDLVQRRLMLLRVLVVWRARNDSVRAGVRGALQGGMRCWWTMFAPLDPRLPRRRRCSAGLGRCG